jgi:hypothetical protein
LFFVAGIDDSFVGEMIILLFMKLPPFNSSFAAEV